MSWPNAAAVPSSVMKPSRPNDFYADISGQPDLIRGLVSAAADGGRLAGELQAAAALIGGRERLIVLTGMGSSLHAARTALARFAGIGRSVSAMDAGELLHFGLGGLRPDAAIVAISQSGRSAETVALAARLRDADPKRTIVGLVNDAGGGLSEALSTSIGMRAGAESTVATRTFLASAVILQLLADHVGGTRDAQVALGSLATAIDALVADRSFEDAAVTLLAPGRSIELVGRGPTLGLAHYGALTIKETAAIPAEALSGGAFRHGPLELVDAPSGAIVLIPGGPTSSLAVRLARAIAADGWPTWAIGQPAGVRELEPSDGLVVTAVRRVDEPLAALALTVPLQRLAGRLAELRGRVPGVLLHGSKVTDVE
jgi:glucosamine--fructose-6-phosphate aminotransferase (isomerizing)